MENMEVIMSEIIVKRRWLKVARRCLGDLFVEKNIWFLEVKNIIAADHLDRSKIYLNMKGSSVLESNFFNFFINLWLVNNENLFAM